MFYKKNRNILFVLLGLACCFAACERDIELDLPEERKLVVLSNFTPDRQFKIRLASTNTLGNNTNNVYPKTANIQLFEDGNYIQNFIFKRDASDTIPYYEMNYPPKARSTYRIVAEVDGFPTATATDVLPPKIPITSLSINSLDSTRQDFANEYSLAARLALPSNKEGQDYFHINVRKDAYFFYLNSSNDTIVETFQDQVFYSLSDEVEQLEILHEPGILVAREALINSNEIDLKLDFYFDPETELKGQIYVELKNVSEAYYLFHKSVGEQEVTSGNDNSIFSVSSTIIHNNIENGIGNFSGYNTSIDSIAW